MSNRRRPRRTVPLNGTPPAANLQPVPWPLTHMEWTDTPPASYAQQTLSWIAGHYREAGRLNAWTCETCGEPFIAFDRHPGVTPAFVAHQTFDPDTECEGTCASGFYRAAAVHQAAKWHGQQQVTPSHEWYRPSAVELKAERGRGRRAVESHVMQGGLLVRPVAA